MVTTQPLLETRSLEVEELLRRQFPDAEFVSWCESADEALIEVYTNASALDVLEAVKDRVAAIMEADDLTVSILPLPLDHYRPARS